MSLPFHKLRTPVPLRDSDYAAIRARVLGEIQQRRSAPLWMRYAAIAACLIVLVTVMFKPEEPIATKPQSIVVQRPMEARVSSPAPPTVAAVRTPPPPSIPSRAKRTVEPSPAAPTLTSIQLETTDPDVRIIWIVDPNTKEES
jgi:hypothetical protein